MKVLVGCEYSGAVREAFRKRGLGWKAEWFAEIEKFPSAVLAHRWPHVPNLGDMTLLPMYLEQGFIAAPDVLVGGTPCFTAGHLVLSANGYVPIESLVPGDEVMTHRGRLRKVVRVGIKDAEVGVLNGVGMLEGITCTPDHPFLSVAFRRQNTRRGGEYALVEHCGTPEWTPSKEMPGKQWCSMLNYEASDHSIKSRLFDARTAMYVAGMYLGDGWVRNWSGKSKKAVVLGMNDVKYSKLLNWIGATPHTVSRERTTTKIAFGDTLFAGWLADNFGRLSHLKKIPAWVMGHPYRAEFLQGFIDTDGCVTKKGCVSFSTTSRSVAYGACDLLNAAGYSASVAFVKTPDTCVIDGRTVNQKDYWHVRGFEAAVSKKSRVRHGYLLRRVRSFQPIGVDTVYNIEVEGDHSYVVNGAVVHNCQAFSLAGLRGGLVDPRGALTIKFVEVANAIDGQRPDDPCVIVWENVPGVLSDKSNAFGCFLAALVGEGIALEPPGGKVV